MVVKRARKTMPEFLQRSFTDAIDEGRVTLPRKLTYQQFAEIACLILLVVTSACHQVPAARFQVAWERDVPYATRANRTLYLDIARPCDASAPVPGVLLLHGGAWRNNDRTMMSNFASALASLGYIAVAIDLRKSTDRDGGFPAAVNDALAALRYMQEHADRSGLDPNRIAVLGESSGGHTALMTAYRTSEQGAPASSPVQAVIGLMAPADLELLYCDNPYGFAHSWLRDLLGVSPAENSDTYRAASPLGLARPGLPPTLLIHGDHDGLVSIRHAEILSDRLLQAGNRCWFARVRGGTHCTVGLARSQEGARYLPVITQFLENVFPGATPSGVEAR